MIQPMLATLVKEPFDHEDWLFEIKWDGYRVLAHNTKKLELISRNSKVMNEAFPHIVEELSPISDQFILDGEVVVLDEKGNASFQLLQNQTHRKHAYYYVFDILFYQNNDLRNFSLIDRKKILHMFVCQYKCKHVKFSECIDKKGVDFFYFAKKKGWEGIIAKRKESSYLATRSREWLKIKSKMRQEVVIGGYTLPRNSRKYFGALLAGLYENGQFVYVGHIGTGFNEKTLQSLYLQMQQWIIKDSPFVYAPKPNAPVTWMQPKLVCEVAFAEWTHEGVMRQPVFKGLRTDKEPTQVHREKEIEIA